MEITTEKVLLAYQETGLTPIDGGFFTTDYQCGCALTALYVHSKDKNNPKEVIKSLFKKSNGSKEDEINVLETIRKELDLPITYDLEHFYEGFDSLSMDHDSEEFLLGIKIRKELEKLIEFADRG